MLFFLQDALDCTLSATCIVERRADGINGRISDEKESLTMEEDAIHEEEEDNKQGKSADD